MLVARGLRWTNRGDKHLVDKPWVDETTIHPYFCIGDKLVPCEVGEIKAQIPHHDALLFSPNLSCIGDKLGIGEVGEIMAKTPTMMLCYLNRCFL